MKDRFAKIRNRFSDRMRGDAMMEVLMDLSA